MRKFWYNTQKLTFLEKLLWFFMCPFLWILSKIYCTCYQFHFFFRKYILLPKLKREFSELESIFSRLLVVGNLNVGGSGKTPTCIFLAKFLMQKGYKVAIVTKGYKGSLTRNTSIRVDLERHNASLVGDESILCAMEAECDIYAGYLRIDTLIMANSHDNYDYFIMDDGLQNANLEARFNFLVIDEEMRFGNKNILPLGPLRCKIQNLTYKNIHLIIITSQNRANVIKDIEDYIGYDFAHRSILEKNTPIDFQGESVILMSGIAFIDKIRLPNANIVKTYSFSDHHYYRLKDIQPVIEESKRLKLRIIVTYKDFVNIPQEYQDCFTPLQLNLTLCQNEDNDLDTDIDSVFVDSL